MASPPRHSPPEINAFPTVPTDKIGYYTPTSYTQNLPPVPTSKLVSKNTDNMVQQLLKEAEVAEVARKTQLKKLLADKTQSSGCIGTGCNVMGGSKRRRRNKKSSTRRKRSRSNNNKSKKH